MGNYTLSHYRYGYIFFINEKTQSLDVYKDYKTKFENQHSKKINVIRFDRGVNPMIVMIVQVNNVQSL